MERDQQETKQNCAQQRGPKCTAQTVPQNYDMKNMLGHAENKTIKTQKGADEDETPKKR